MPTYDELLKNIKSSRGSSAIYSGQQEQQFEQTETPKRSLLEKIGGFLGVEKLAKGTAGTLFTFSKEYKNLVKDLQEGKITPEQYESVVGDIMPSSKEVIGSALQTGATIATAGISAGKFIPTATKLATTGAVSGMGKGLEENKSIEDSLKQAFTSGLASAATYGALVGIGKMGKAVLEKLPSKLYNSVVKIDQQSANMMLNEKQIGTLGKLKAISDSEVSKLNDAIAQKITSKSGSFTSKEFVSKVYNELKQKWQGYSKDQIVKAMKAAGIDPFLKNKTVNFKVADNVRRGIGETLGTVWKTDNPKFNQSVRMKIWQEIVNTVRPATNTTNEFSRLATYTKSAIKLGKILDNQSKKFNINLYDLIGGGLGYAGGGLPGALAVGGARRLSESAVGKTGVAVGLNELNKLLEKIPTDSVGRISKTALINLIKGQ